MARPKRMSARSLAGSLLTVTILAACGGSTPSAVPGDGDGTGVNFDPAQCQQEVAELTVGADWDAIRAIDEPRFVRADQEPDLGLLPDHRVIGLRIGDQAYAVPLGEIAAREVVNLDRSEDRPVDLAITYCGLTGSSLAFDRSPVGDVRMAVSGFLLHNNLVMFDRTDPPTLWPQMSGRPLCGPPKVDRLPQWPVMEVRWEAWEELHPATLVMRRPELSATGSSPRESSSLARSSGGPDDRVIGAPSSGQDPGIAFRFADLEALPDARQVVPFSYEDEGYVLLWSDHAMGGMAFLPRTESGADVRLVPVGGGFQDEETGSLFTLDGRGVEGPLGGESLVPLTRTYVAFEGAWRKFHPNTRSWGP